MKILLQPKSNLTFPFLNHPVEHQQWTAARVMVYVLVVGLAVKEELEGASVGSTGTEKKVRVGFCLSDSIIEALSSWQR